MTPLVRVERVCKTFRLGETTIAALKEIDLSIAQGEFLAVVGPSGSGKSTLLNLIGCIEKPDSGRIFIEGSDVTSRPLDELAVLRARRIGYIFQTFNLLPVLTVTENVEYPLWLRGLSGDERRRKALEALVQVGLERFSAHKPRELSGGQRQRVAVARALVGQPALILADEPTANLDHRTGLEIIELMKDLNASTGTTFLFSTHDPKIMAEASRVVQMADGLLLAQASR